MSTTFASRPGHQPRGRAAVALLDRACHLDVASWIALRHADASSLRPSWLASARRDRDRACAGVTVAGGWLVARAGWRQMSTLAEVEKCGTVHALGMGLRSSRLRGGGCHQDIDDHELS